MVFFSAPSRFSPQLKNKCALFGFLKDPSTSEKMLLTHVSISNHAKSQRMHLPKYSAKPNKDEDISACTS